MTITTRSKKESLEAVLSRIAGFPVEITVRGMLDFTLSADGHQDFSKCLQWLDITGRVASHETIYDSECNLTCCYITFTE